MLSSLTIEIANQDLQELEDAANPMDDNISRKREAQGEWLAYWRDGKQFRSSPYGICHHESEEMCDDPEEAADALRA